MDLSDTLFRPLLEGPEQVMTSREHLTSPGEHMHPYPSVMPLWVSRGCNGMCTGDYQSSLGVRTLQIGSIFGPISGPIPRGRPTSDPFRDPFWTPPETLCASTPYLYHLLTTCIPYPSVMPLWVSRGWHGVFTRWYQVLQPLQKGSK